jgi:hypothetical protein
MQTGENYLRNLPKLVGLWADDIDRLDIRDAPETDDSFESLGPKPQDTPLGKPERSGKWGTS